DVGVGQRTGEPVPTVGGDFRVVIIVVQSEESPLQRPLVRGRLLTEEIQARIAVALAKAAEDLVECPVLLDDVEDVLDGIEDLGYRVERSPYDARRLRSVRRHDG